MELSENFLKKLERKSTGTATCREGIDRRSSLLPRRMEPKN